MYGHLFMIVFLILCNATEVRAKSGDTIDEYVDELGQSIKVVQADADLPYFEEKYGKWHILKYYKNKKKFCYTVLYGSEVVSNYKEPRKPYIMFSINHNLVPFFRVYSDYGISKGFGIVVSIEGNNFYLDVDSEDYGLTSGSSEDFKIATAMSSAEELLALSRGKKGVYAVDSYVISDFKVVLDKLVKLCS